ncbi:MAG: GNAT family N-acetyltransferase [Saprospiraceae bacterium]
MNVSFEEIIYSSPDYDECLALRYKVLREPLGLDYTEDQILQEWNQKHFILRDVQGRIIACLVFHLQPEEVLKMRQVVVTEDLQSKGLGKKLIEQAEIWAIQNQFKKIVLCARDLAVPFYLKLGYTRVGEEFLEVGIPHIEMYKQLQI